MASSGSSLHWRALRIQRHFGSRVIRGRPRPAVARISSLLATSHRAVIKEVSRAAKVARAGRTLLVGSGRTKLPTHLPKGHHPMPGSTLLAGGGTGASVAQCRLFCAFALASHRAGPGPAQGVASTWPRNELPPPDEQFRAALGRSAARASRVITVVTRMPAPKPGTYRFICARPWRRHRDPVRAASRRALVARRAGSGVAVGISRALPRARGDARRAGDAAVGEERFHRDVPGVAGHDAARREVGSIMDHPIWQGRPGDQMRPRRHLGRMELRFLLTPAKAAVALNPDGASPPFRGYRSPGW